MASPKRSPILKGVHTLRKQRSPLPSTAILKSEPDEEKPLGTCPECLNEYPLLSPDDLRAHIAPSGEYCPGSRGAPLEANR